MNNVISLSFLSHFIFCKVKWQHFKGAVENVTMYLVGNLNLVSFLTVNFFFENLSTIDKVAICNAMSYFFGPPCSFIYSDDS